jgi:hypothetical protein
MGEVPTLDDVLVSVVDVRDCREFIVGHPIAALSSTELIKLACGEGLLQ